MLFKWEDICGPQGCAVQEEVSNDGALKESPKGDILIDRNLHEVLDTAVMPTLDTLPLIWTSNVAKLESLLDHSVRLRVFSIPPRDGGRLAILFSGIYSLTKVVLIVWFLLPLYIAISPLMKQSIY